MEKRWKLLREWWLGRIRGTSLFEFGTIQIVGLVFLYIPFKISILSIFGDNVVVWQLFISSGLGGSGWIFF